MTEEQLLHTPLNGTAEYVAALDTLCASARHSLRLFENDFDGLGFNSPARYDSLHKFLLSGQNSRLYILAHDTRNLQNFCPRIMTLLRLFSQQMFIYQTPVNLRQLSEPIAIADEAHFVRRFHFDDTRGVFAQNDPAGARVLKSRFEEMWANSHPGANASQLGL